jgi:hypothetical protein
MSVGLISSFAALPRYSGTFNHENWKKFNVFGGLYIFLVYLPFLADFYIYFTTYGLRQLTSFVAIEGVVIMTIISLILILEILNQCACTGMAERDLGKRAGLNLLGKGKKGKKKAMRVGMGNDDEYDNELFYDSELEAMSEVEYADIEERVDEEEEEGEYEEEEDGEEEEMSEVSEEVSE